MNRLVYLLITLVFLSCQNTKEKNQKQSNEDSVKTQTSNRTPGKKKKKKKSKSPRKAAMALVGNNHIHIDYSSPRARGRQIFGGLVAYDEVWVTGAHKATNINFDNDVIVGGTKIKKGKYGLFTIPGENQWIIIINEKWDMHLADDYDQQSDIVRVKADVNILEKAVEALTFEVISVDDTKGNVTIKWANSSVSFEVENHQ